MKVLVTGVAGFIGYHVARRLVDQGHAVLGIDNLNRYYDVRLKLDRLRDLGLEFAGDVGPAAGPAGDAGPAGGDAGDGQGEPEAGRAPSGLRFRRLDLTDSGRTAALFAEERFDAVCHLAAQAGVRYSLSDPFAYTANNVHGFLSVLEAARHHPVRHLVYASSSSVYGLDRHVPFGETGAADHPVSLYAATKRANELMAHSYSHLFGIPTTGLRFFTVYGPWGRPDMALFQFTRALLREEPIELYNHGEMRRDFTYVDDAVDAVVRVLERPAQGVAGWDGRQSSLSPAPARVYNVGNGAPASVYDLVQALEQELGMEARVRKVPMQPGDVAQTWADCTALRAELGWTAHVTIREGVRRFVAWYRRYNGPP